MQSMTTLMSGLNLRQGFTQTMATPARQSGSIDKTVAKIFNHFFEGLKVIFPASIAVLKTAADIVQFKSQWIAAFAENNINSSSMINAGLRIARQQKSPFLPSVGQFIDWCQQGCAEDYGLPTPQQLCEKLQAYCLVRGHDDAQYFDYGSDANYWLVHDLYRAMIDGRLSAKELEGKSKELIELLSQKLRNGYVVPKPRVAIEKYQTLKPTSREQSLENIKKIKERFKFSRVKPSGRQSSTPLSLDEKIYYETQAITAHNVESTPETSSTHDDSLNENVCNMLAVNNIKIADTFEEKSKEIKLLNDSSSSLVDEQKKNNSQATIDNKVALMTEISQANDELLVEVLGDMPQVQPKVTDEPINDNFQVKPEILISTQCRLSFASKINFKWPRTSSEQFAIGEPERILVHPKSRKINFSSEHQNMGHQTKQSIGNLIEFATPTLKKNTENYYKQTYLAAQRKPPCL